MVDKGLSMLSRSPNHLFMGATFRKSWYHCLRGKS